MALEHLLQYGVLGVIAIVFFSGYFEDRKESKVYRREQDAEDKAFKEKMVEHEVNYLTVLTETKKAMEQATMVFTDTQEVHGNLDYITRDISKTVNLTHGMTEKLEGNQVELMKVMDSLTNNFDELKGKVDVVQNEIDVIKLYLIPEDSGGEIR